MAQRLSRRLVVKAFAERLMQPGAAPARLARALAAYLLETNQAKQADLYLADIARQLSQRGHASGEVTSAHKLSSETLAALKQLVAQQTGAAHVELRQSIDEQLLGGVRLSFDGRELDTTIRTKLNQLQA